MKSRADCRPWTPPSPSGRLLLEESRRLIAGGTDFALESTLSGKTQARIIENAKGLGYRISLFYLWLSSAEESERRVQHRVASGGHDVPRDAIYRRFPRSYTNFFEFYVPLADEWSFWDASSTTPTCVATSATNQAEKVREHYNVSY